MIWHQTGIAYQEDVSREAAEDLYRKSLAIKVQLGDILGQACYARSIGGIVR